MPVSQSLLFPLLFLKASRNVNRNPNVIKSRTKTIILLLAEKGTLRQTALTAGGIPVGISSMSCRKRDKDFPVSGTLWLLPGHGFMFAPETGTFCALFSIFSGKLEFWAVLFPSITQDLWCFSFLLPSEAASPRMAEDTRRGGLGEPCFPHEPTCSCILW